MSQVLIPAALLPVGAAIVAMSVAWGVLQAESSFASEERSRIDKIARESLKKAQENGQAQAVTETKLSAIVASLERSEKTQQQTNEQIQALVQALLSKK
ncbi:MAG TPA: hypothetical protein DCL66_01660 [Gammaproteobacteria bacterium]|nr:hypothetical protein [Gammaproteobacteria bacterium]